MEISENSVCKRAFRVSHELPDEHKVAFFDESKSELVVVNALGGAIWQMLDGELSVRGICDLLLEEVQDAPPREQVEREVISFLQSLLARQAIVVLSE